MSVCLSAAASTTSTAVASTTSTRASASWSRWPRLYFRHDDDVCVLYVRGSGGCWPDDWSLVVVAGEVFVVERQRLRLAHKTVKAESNY